MQSSRNDNLERTQQNVDEVVGIMKNNVKAAMDRDDKLKEIGTKSEILEEGARSFQRSAVRVSDKMRWKNLKMKLIIAFVILVLIILFIVVPIAVNANKSKSQ